LSKYENNLNYSFDVLTDFIYHGKSKEEYTVKIDNDLVLNWLKRIGLVYHGVMVFL